MKSIRTRMLMVTALLSAASAFSATPTIGVASAFGSFTINSAQVDGNANIFEGSQLRTDKSASQVFLQSGTSVRLATNSAGSVYSDRFVLQEGAARFDNLNSYKVEAAGYKVQGDGSDAQAVVRFNQGSIEVAALSGSVRVFDRQGVMLTRVGAGTASAFRNGGQSGASGSGAGGTSTTTKVILYASVAAALAGLGLGIAAVTNSNNSSPSTSP